MSQDLHYEIVVVGGGPAGMAAACRAAECHKRVALIDDNPDLGGQIWRSDRHKQSTADARRWFRKLLDIPFPVLSQMPVVGAPELGCLLVANGPDQLRITYDKLILALGARERFLPFPGWTLPNVMGAGGLQALVKSGVPITNKRVVVAGSGPLLLAVAAFLQKQRAKVVHIAEQASWKSLIRFASHLLHYPGKFYQAMHLQWQLRGVRYTPGFWPVGAHGDAFLESVSITNGDRVEKIPCDYLACGFGLVPNLELPELLGCKRTSTGVTVDEWQQSTLPNVFCAGETVGIGGVDTALVEGQIAGYAASGDFKRAQRLLNKRDKARRWAQLLEATFELRPELRKLATPETIVCRCEDVTFDKLAKRRNWVEAKLQTRIGMGPCQGRVCGPAVEFLKGWERPSIRPPLFPVPLSGLKD